MRRIAVVLLLLSFVGLSFAPPVHAAFNPVPSAEEVGSMVDSQANSGKTAKELYTVNNQALYMAGGACLITGCSNDKTSTFYYGKSTLATIGNMVTFIYDNPPADFALWTTDTAQTLGFLPKQIHAQGIGFTGLSPLLPVWRAFRNVSYLLLAVSIMVIGFMVMFRRKIDPKTVVTVQNSLPRIVITMLLITFSYAIVGLMIDIMYILIVFINLIMQSGFTGTTDLFANLTSGGFFALLGAVFGPVTRFAPGTQVPGDLLRGQFGQALIDLGKGALFSVGTLGVGPLFQLILAIAFLFAFIRILFLLLNSYIQIILAVIIGPIQILLDVFPGTNGFSSWIKNLAANLVVFPITILMLILGNVLGKTFTNGNLWVPPLLPQPLGQVNGQTVGGVGGLALSLISLGIILLIPTVVNGFKEALKVKAAIPAGVGAIFGPMGAGVGQVMQLGYQGMFIASPFLHKGQPSTPVGRQTKAAQEGPEGALNQVTGGGK